MADLDCLGFIGAQVALDTYAASSQGSVRTAVKATLTQLLSSIAEKLKEKETVKVRVIWGLQSQK